MAKFIALAHIHFKSPSRWAIIILLLGSFKNELDNNIIYKFAIMEYIITATLIHKRVKFRG